MKKPFFSHGDIWFQPPEAPAAVRRLSGALAIGGINVAQLIQAAMYRNTVLTAEQEAAQADDIVQAAVRTLVDWLQKMDLHADVRAALQTLEPTSGYAPDGPAPAPAAPQSDPDPAGSSPSAEAPVR